MLGYIRSKAKLLSCGFPVDQIDICNYFLCDSSQYGLLPDRPHLHRYTSSGLSVISLFESRSNIRPVIFMGPFSVTSMVACDLNSFLSSITDQLSLNSAFLWAPSQKG